MANAKRKPINMSQASNQSGIKGKIQEVATEDNLSNFIIRTRMKIALFDEDAFVADEATAFKADEKLNLDKIREYFSVHEQRLKAVGRKNDKIKAFDVRFQIEPVMESSKNAQTITSKNMLGLMQQKVVEGYEMFNRNVSPKQRANFNAKHNYLLEGNTFEKGM